MLFICAHNMVTHFYFLNGTLYSKNNIIKTVIIKNKYIIANKVVSIKQLLIQIFLFLFY